MAFLPAQASGERDVLRTFLSQQFGQARSSVYGLTDEQLDLTPSASAFSLSGLLHHLIDVADGWGALLAAAPDRPSEGAGTADDGHDRSAQERLTAEVLLTRFDRAAAELDRAVAAVDLDIHVCRPEGAWFPEELTGWQARWVITHLIAEVARHAGHADIIRESLDGKQSYELNARADGELADDEEFPSW